MSLVQSYLITALWSSTDDNGQPLDDNYSIDDLSKEILKRAEKDTSSFIEKAGHLLNGYSLETAMHDFWLTRNGHGAGFWDGDYEDSIGEKLTELSKEFGEINLYVGDDSKLYFDRGES
jgi:hypothetical protein